MPITGICHDFAFTRCYDQSQWMTKPSALQDVRLWAKLKEHMTKVDPPRLKDLDKGVLTIVNPTKQHNSPSFCTHSYYIEDKKLFSTNDPFMTLMVKKVDVVNVCDKVQAVSYSIADLCEKMNMNVANKTAKIGDDKRDFQFYWCSVETVKTDWWKGVVINQSRSQRFFKWLKKLF